MRDKVYDCTSLVHPHASALSQPLAIDLFSGLGGWTEGLTAAGWFVIRFDLEDMCRLLGEPYPEHSSLVIQDVLTIHGSQFRDVGLIVSSSPCQDFSYRAMPWSRAKALHAPFLGMWLFHAQFRIQREASEAAGRHIPMVVENVRGAIPWVGRSAWNFGSYHLWGDVPALMPIPAGRSAVKVPGMGAGWVGPDDPRHKPGLAFNPAPQGARVRAERAAALEGDGRKNPGFRFDGSGRSFQSESVSRHVEGQKTPGAPPDEHVFDMPAGMKPPARVSEEAPADGRKGAGAGAGAVWFDQNTSSLPSHSPRRKAASAKIAKIPLVLSTFIGRVYYP